jgi:hypothetical protein
MVRERVRGSREFLSVVKATMVARTATMSAAVGLAMALIQVREL